MGNHINNCGARRERMPDNAARFTQKVPGRKKLREPYGLAQFSLY